MIDMVKFNINVSIPLREDTLSNHFTNLLLGSTPNEVSIPLREDTLSNKTNKNE